MKDAPLHPGVFLRAILKREAIPVLPLAEVLGVSRAALHNLLNGKASMTADMAVRIERAVGFTAESLLEYQMTYDLWMARAKLAASLKVMSQKFFIHDADQPEVSS